MKIGFKLPVASAIAFLILLFAIILNTALYFQNQAYAHKNQKLILENDSVISVTIELKDSIEKMISKKRHS